MMASKGAVVSGRQGDGEGGLKFDPSIYVPAVAGYYKAPNGQMLSFPFNSSTTVFHYNRDAFKAAARSRQTAKTGPSRSGRSAAESGGPQMPVYHLVGKLDPARSFSAWSQRGSSRPNATALTASIRALRSTRRCTCVISRTGQHVQTKACSSTKAAATPPMPRSCPRVRHDHGFLGALRNVKRNSKFTGGISTLPYYPDVQARRRTPHRRCQPVGLAGKKPPDTKAWPRFSLPSRRPTWPRNESHMRTGYLPVTIPSYEPDRKERFLQGKPGTDVSSRR